MTNKEELKAEINTLKIEYADYAMCHWVEDDSPIRNEVEKLEEQLESVDICNEKLIKNNISKELMEEILGKYRNRINKDK